jgi:hypothetical protein
VRLGGKLGDKEVKTGLSRFCGVEGNKAKLADCLGKQYTWSIGDGSIKRSTDDANIKRLIRSRQAPDVLKVGERRHSTESPLPRVNGFWQSSGRQDILTSVDHFWVRSSSGVPCSDIGSCSGLS